MTDVVICERFGGYGWSRELYEALGFHHGDDYAKARETPRDDPALVAAVKELGERANSRFCTLAVVSVPDDACWYIHEYDGYETVYECHRAWSSDGEERMSNED